MNDRGVSINYNGDEIVNLSGDGSLKLLTKNKYMEDDIEVDITRDMTIIEKTVTENGVYDAEDDDADGYDTVSVNVPNTYAAGDEGKVVSNGDLVSQTSVTKTANGVYDTTLNDEVNIDVPNTYTASDEGKVVSSGALVGQTSKTVTENGSYDTTLNNEVVVNVQGSGGGGSVLSGATPPSASLGSDGDLYVQSIPITSNINFVEYLQSSGTQYIDTGIIADQNTSYMIDYENITPAWRFGARQSAQSRSILVTPSSSSATNSEYVDYGTARYTAGSLESRRKISEKNGVLYINDVVVSRYSVQTFTTPSSLLIFAVHQASTVQNSGSTRFYRVVIWQDGVPIADYLPCLDTNDVPCMWDNINKVYVYNSGTGTFAYGSTATPDKLQDVLYVKNNGAWVYIGEADGVTT